MLLSACAGDADTVAAEHAQQLSGAAAPEGAHDAGAADDAGALPDAVIGGVTLAGPACRPGSFTIAYEDHPSPQSGHRNFTVYPRPHQVASNADSPFSDSSCSLVVPVRAPDGWQYRLEQVDLRADVDLKAGAEGQIDLTYGFMGSPSVQLSHKKILIGPLRDPKLAIDDAVDPAQREGDSAWSSCTDFRSLTLTTSLFLESPVQPRTGGVDPETQSQIKLTQIGPLKLALRRCPQVVAP